MRINVYAEEMSRNPEVKSVEKNGYFGLRIYLDGSPKLHYTKEDDDRQAITFWGIRKCTELSHAIAKAMAEFPHAAKSAS